MAKKNSGGKPGRRTASAQRFKIEKKAKQQLKHADKLNLTVSTTNSVAAVPRAACPLKAKVPQATAVNQHGTGVEQVGKVERVKKFGRVEKRRVDRSRVIGKQTNLEGLAQDAARRAADFERRAEFVEETRSKDYTGGCQRVEHSLKAYYREVKKVIEAADVVVEVLDARDPLGSRCPQVEQAVLEAGPHKKIVLLLNKIDLVPRDNVEAWLKHLRNEFPTVAFKACTQTQADRLSQSRVPLNLASDELRGSSRCLGADVLMTLLGNYCRSHDIRTAITIGVVGFPNTGKSSVINSLKRSKACSVGATPGVTKSMQVVQLDKHIKLLDSPGVVMADGKSDASIVLRNSVKLEALEDPIPAVAIVVSRCSREQLMNHYKVAQFASVDDFLALLARRYGDLRRGGVPDSNKAARRVLMDWNLGRITYYTLPPETYQMSKHVTAEIVSTMSKAFDIDALLSHERDTLKGLKLTSSLGDIVVPSEGFTAGVMDIEGGDEGAQGIVGGGHGDFNQASDTVDSDEEDEEGAEKMDDDSTSVIVKFDGGKKAAHLSTNVSTSKSPLAAGARGQGGKVRGDKGQGVKGGKVVKPVVLPGNMQQNRDLKKAFKKMKKQRKRSDTLAGNLSAALNDGLANLL